MQTNECIAGEPIFLTVDSMFCESAYVFQRFPFQFKDDWPENVRQLIAFFLTHPITNLISARSTAIVAMLRLLLLSSLILLFPRLCQLFRLLLMLWLAAP